MPQDNANRASVSSYLLDTYLASDRIHGARRGHELGRVDLVAFPLAGQVAADERRNLLVRGARAHQALDVVFLDGEQAVAQLAVCRQPDAVAVETEGAAHRGDESHAADAIREGVLRGRCARIGIGHRRERRAPASEYAFAD